MKPRSTVFRGVYELKPAEGNMQLAQHRNLWNIAAEVAHCDQDLSDIWQCTSQVAAHVMAGLRPQHWVHRPNNSRELARDMTSEFRSDLVALLPRLRRFAINLTGDMSQADDLVQQGCEKALLKQSQWEPGTRLDSWMYRIIQNLHIDQLRSQGRRSAHLHEDGVAELADFRSQAQPEQENMLSVVSGLIDQLPGEQRVVMTLVAVEEYSYREVADILGIPIGTVMSRLARARSRIIVMLDAGGEQNHD